MKVPQPTCPLVQFTAAEECNAHFLVLRVWTALRESTAHYRGSHWIEEAHRSIDCNVYLATDKLRVYRMSISLKVTIQQVALSQHSTNLLSLSQYNQEHRPISFQLQARIGSYVFSRRSILHNLSNSETLRYQRVESGRHCAMVLADSLPLVRKEPKSNAFTSEPGYAP